MIERQHRVGLATTEVGLQLHDRIAALPGDALHAADQQALQALREERTAKELGRLSILVGDFPQMDLPESAANSAC